MRRRLTIAILAVVTGTLVLAVAGSILLVQKAAISTAENELTPEAQAIAQLFQVRGALTDLKVRDLLRKGGGFDTLNVVGLSSGGGFSSLTSPLSPSDLDPSALLTGETVSGNVGHEVYAAVPLQLTSLQKIAFGVTSSSDALLVITRHVDDPVNGIQYYLLVAGVVLVIGAAVATLLARRITSPLIGAVSTTSRIAGGDLSARVPLNPHDYPELKQLSESINQMGESLARSEGLGRQFLLSVSHELRTPLTSIRGYADAVADGTTDDVTGAVHVIGNEARRLERLVQDLLDLARLDARQFSFHTERIDCADVLSTVANGFRPEADVSGIELAVSVPEAEDLLVDSDPDRLGQVLANLIENAFKFARSKVEVGAGRSGQAVVIWVTDDGPGIAPQDLSHVFERHFTSDRVPARRLGTGLGLAIVAELTGAMGSRCIAESPVADGRGTRMTVWLTAAPTAETHDLESSASAIPDSSTDPAAL